MALRCPINVFVSKCMNFNSPQAFVIVILAAEFYKIVHFGMDYANLFVVGFLADITFDAVEYRSYIFCKSHMMVGSKSIRPYSSGEMNIPYLRSPSKQ